MKRENALNIMKSKSTKQTYETSNPRYWTKMIVLTERLDEIFDWFKIRKQILLLLDDDIDENAVMTYRTDYVITP